MTWPATWASGIRFDVEGEEIELDRSILDEIGDPLLHLIRNAADHGIEPPDVRVAAGKPAEGRILWRPLASGTASPSA